MSLSIFNTTIKVRMLLKFLNVFIHTLVMPYTVVYFSEKVGNKTTTIMIITIAIVSIIGYIIGGRLSDKIGRKKVIIFNEVFTGLGFLIVSYFNNLTDFHMIAIFVTFCFIYFFETAADPAYGALIIDVSTDEIRKQMYTYFMWLSTVAFALGSLIGGFFFEKHSTILFFIVGVISILSAILTLILIKDTYIEDKKTQHLIINSLDNQVSEIQLQKYSFQKIFIIFCLAQLLLAVLKEQFPNYLSIRFVNSYPLENYNISGYELIAYLNIEDTIIASLGVFFILKLVNYMTENQSLYLGVSLFVIGNILLSFYLDLYILLLGMFLMSVGGLIYIPTLQALTAKIIPENSRGTYLSILGLVGVLGGMIASLFIWGMDFLETKIVTILYLILGLCLIGTLFILKKRLK